MPDLCNNADDEKKNIPWLWVLIILGIISFIFYLFWVEYNDSILLSGQDIVPKSFFSGT